MQNSFSARPTGPRLLMGTFLLSILLCGGLLNVFLGFSMAHAAGGKANFALQPVLYDPS